MQKHQIKLNLQELEFERKITKQIINKNCN